MPEIKNYALGIGYNSQAAREFDIEETRVFLEELRQAHNIPQWHCLCAPEKAYRPQFLQELADALRAPLLLCGKAELQKQADRCLTESLRSLELYGCGSAAEAASLCGIGDGIESRGRKAELLVPRVKFGMLTFAVAYRR